MIYISANLFCSSNFDSATVRSVGPGNTSTGCLFLSPLFIEVHTKANSALSLSVYASEEAGFFVATIRVSVNAKRGSDSEKDGGRNEQTNFAAPGIFI